MIEVDVSLTSDAIPVLSHNFRPGNEDYYNSKIPTLFEFKKAKIRDRYTPLTLDEFIACYKDFDGYIFVDQALGVEEFDFAEYFRQHVSHERMQRFILQVHTFEDLKYYGTSKVFGGIHFDLSRNYNGPYGACGLAPYVFNMLKLRGCDSFIKMLKSHGCDSVSFGDCAITPEIANMVKAFNDANIVISVARCNSIKRYNEWRRIGVTCIDTDYLLPDDIKGLE